MSILNQEEGGFGERIDWALFIAVALLAVIGVVNLYSATSVYTLSRADMYVSQVYFLAAGTALAILVTVIDYRHFERIAYPLYVAGLMTLVLVLALGKGIRGSSRWINLGGFGFQPSEFTKIWLILALAKYFHNSPRSEGPKLLRELTVPALLTAIPCFLVLKQPDLGTALIHGLIFLAIASLQRIKLSSLFLLGAFTVMSLPLFWLYGMKDYQKERITSFLSPENDITGAGYHAYHARIAIGNGGFLGQGFAKGSQNQYYFLPDQYSDFPFSVLAEDWGFVGSLVLLSLYAFLVLWALRIASQAKDRFGAVVAVGVGALLFWHSVFNIGMVSGLLPVVGVTLPLLSYGGSSLLTIMLGLGLLMNVSIRRPHLAQLYSRRLVFVR
ncbi:MAG: rod shape-determining protein RodA [Myxococcales bacterium]|nr:rod shape-determining protein RodA [Polyangiaceae bacterium]MDW8250516.1 rod shape-determining protein RodA [Myxococcales bacterium]